jgi:pyruvate, water dikinase
MTRPEFMPLVRLAKAIVTSEGGVTSHAAVIARELKIPCIVGVKDVLSRIKDGDLVEVDANKGIIKILKRE